MVDNLNIAHTHIKLCFFWYEQTTLVVLLVLLYIHTEEAEWCILADALWKLWVQIQHVLYLNAGLTELTEAGWSRPTCGFSYQPPAPSPADIRQLGMHGSLFSKTNKEMEKLLCKEPPNENEKPIHKDSRDLVLWLCAMFCTWLILCYEEHNFFHITKSRLLSRIFTVFLFLPLLSKTWVKSDDLDHSAETQTYIICYCV